MKLKEKLFLSARIGYISLFDEGLFLRLYNQSAYIVNELQQQNLTLSCNVIKYLHNQPIVYCAFPQKNLYNRFSNAVKTPWGYQITGNFDISDYDNWFKWAFNHASERIKKRHQPESLYRTYPSSLSTSSQPAKFIENKECLQTQHVFLDNQQIAFLKNWQRELYPIAVTEGFIESLKQRLLASPKDED